MLRGVHRKFRLGLLARAAVSCPCSAGIRAARSPFSPAPFMPLNHPGSLGWVSLSSWGFSWLPAGLETPDSCRALP